MIHAPCTAMVWAPQSKMYGHALACQCYVALHVNRWIYSEGSVGGINGDSTQLFLSKSQTTSNAFVSLQCTAPSLIKVNADHPSASHLLLPSQDLHVMIHKSPKRGDFLQ